MTLTVEAQGAAGYAWYFHGQLLQDGVQPTYDLGPVTVDDFGAYECDVFGPGECAMARAPLRVNVFDTIPQIAVQPQDTYGCVMGAATLSVITNTTGIAWFKDGLLVEGAHAPDLVFEHLAPSDAGTYVCRVSDFFCGSILSEPARLTVNSADFNGDGDIGTDADIAAFFACLSGACCRNCGTADFNADGDIGTDRDIESFFRVLSGGPC